MGASSPAPSRSTPEGRGKDEIIEEHPHVEEEEPGPEIAFSQFAHGSIQHDPLPDKTKPKYTECDPPIIQADRQYGQWVINELSDEVESQ